MDKKSLRKEIYYLFDEMPDSKRMSLSREASDRLMAQSLWKEAEQILTYLTFRKEFETEHLIRSALAEGKQVAVPRIYGKEMKFHYLNSLDDNLEINKWGIREPLTGSDLWNASRGKTLILTPGLAFGPSGSRLGRGGGFYDRFLSKIEEGIKTVGLCFESQHREDIPLEEHDRRLDALCTDKRFILF